MGLLSEHTKHTGSRDDEMEDVKSAIVQRIGGEIVASSTPNKTISKWMDIFGVTATELAKEMGITPSVVCDYERGRRPSPRIETIRRFAEALVALDEKKGSAIIQKYAMIRNFDDDILSTREFSEPVKISSFIKAIEGETQSKITGDHQLFGYTLINSKKAIMSFNAFDFLKIYGWSTERALIFTDITYGRSPMIAIRVHPMKPALVVYHKPAVLDPLAQKLAEADNIPLVITRLEMLEMIKRLDVL